MKRSILLSLAFLTATGAALPAQESLASASVSVSADSTAIRDAARDYIMGWYEADPVRMQRALHPELVKRIVQSRPSARSVLENMTAEQLIGMTRGGGGRNTPAGERRADIRILDIFGNSASVRVDARSWVDYLQLARVDGRWVIVNVLWEMRPAG